MHSGGLRLVGVIASRTPFRYRSAKDATFTGRQKIKTEAGPAAPAAMEGSSYPRVTQWPTRYMAPASNRHRFDSRVARVACFISAWLNPTSIRTYLSER